MAIKDYTDYLGKHVTFNVPFSGMGDMFGDKIVETVSGTINMVCLSSDLEDSEFFVNDDSYRFSDTVFFQVLDNPAIHN